MDVAIAIRATRLVGHPGVFLSFEGIEGCGKTTQVTKLEEYLKSLGHQVLSLREPGGTEFGEGLRNVILKSKIPLDPMAEVFLFLAARTQLLKERIIPHLKKSSKHIVLLDRYLDSTLAYQGQARGLDFETIEKLHEFPPLNLKPDRTIYFQIDLKTSFERQNQRANEQDYFEKEKQDFYQKLIDGYDTIASKEPGRVKVIDAKKEIDEVFKQTKKVIGEALEK